MLILSSWQCVPAEKKQAQLLVEVASHTRAMYRVVPICNDGNETAADISIANDTSFGLGAFVISTDVERAEKTARNHREAGSCFVNAPVASDPRLPFGGIKESGYGRELAEDGIKAFMNVKTVYIS